MVMVKKKKKDNIKNYQEKNREENRKQHYACKRNDWGKNIIEDSEIVSARQRSAGEEFFTVYFCKDQENII